MLSLRPNARTFAAAVALCTAAAHVSACAREPEPGYVIGVYPGAEQEVLGEIYRGTMASTGLDVEVTQLDPSGGLGMLDALRTGEADMVITCTGTILRQANPQLAQQLADDFAGADTGANDNSASESVYEEAVGTFPPGVKTLDPSPAQGCASEGDLPENVVPVFAKAALSRGQEQRINTTNRALATSDLEEMARAVDDGEPVDRVAAEWAGENLRGIAGAPTQTEDPEA